MEASEPLTVGSTQLGRNLPWEYDELVLALDGYFRAPRARQTKPDPAIADLSSVLRALLPFVDRPGLSAFAT